MDLEFYYNVYAIVDEIPEGKVATYQMIAALAGRAKNSRLVGTALRCSSMYGTFPCHRVVHFNGSLVMGWDQQRALLEEEGVSFLQNGHVDLKKHRWKVSLV